MSGLRHIVVTSLVSACVLASAGTAIGAENPPAGGFSVASTAATSTVTISGKGFGHGVGLSQDGDLELGREGKKMPQILGYFYPGTRFGTIGDFTIRAAIVEVDGRKPIDVTLPAGGVVRVGTSGVSVAKGGTAQLTHGSDGYDVKLLDPPSNARADTVSANGSMPYSVYSSGLEVTGGSSYHGVITVAADGKKLRAINALPIETYLDGLGEVRDPSWPAASLQAQVVAARSYALHSVHTGSLFDVWSDDRSQVYLGASGEYDALSAAVTATRGLVLTYDGAVADTVYSASGGGVTATAAEGFGDDPTVAAGEPYLTAHTYPTANPMPWTVTYALATIGSALSYPGTLTGLTITSVGPSGRATGVTLTGSSGPMLVPGLALYHDLRLQSNLYTLGPVTVGGVPTATLPTGTTDSGAGGAGDTPDGSAAGAALAGGTLTPHLISGAASTTAPLPTPSPIATLPSAAPTPASTSDTTASPTVAGPPARPVAPRTSATALRTQPAAVKPLAIALWLLALLTFASTVLLRRRKGPKILPREDSSQA